MKFLEDIEILVEVTRDDIDNGLRSNSEQCPIALATRRALTGANTNWNGSIEVDGGISLNYGIYTLYRVKYCHPELNQDIDMFIKRFDNEDYVAPFSFKANFGESE